MKFTSAKKIEKLNKMVYEREKQKTYKDLNMSRFIDKK